LKVSQEYLIKLPKTQVIKIFLTIPLFISTSSELLLKQAVKDGIIRANPAEHETVCPKVIVKANARRTTA
jgi:hypothetical protein